MDLILKELESRPNVKFKYFCNYEGGGIDDFGQGIFQFPLDPAVKSSKPSTSIEGKGAVGNVKPKSLSQYMRDSRFKNFPQLLIVNPQRQTSWKQRTHASYQELHFDENITLKPHADNLDQQEASYTLIAFSLFDEKKGGQGHYTVYCKNGNKVWYLFNDEYKTYKGPNIEAKYQGREKLFARVTSLYYLKNEEARDYDDVEEKSTSTVFAVEDSQMKADEGATNKKTLDKEEKERLTQTKEHAEKKAEEKSTSTVFLVEDSQMKADEGATNKKKLDEEEKERLTQTKEHAKKKADEEATKNKAANAQMKEHMKDDEEATNKKASDEKEKNTGPVMELLAADVDEGLKADEEDTKKKTSEEKEKTTTEVMEGSIAKVEERLTVEVEETVGKVGEGEKDVNTENPTSTVPETMNGAYISSPVQHNNILRSHQITFHRTISGW